MPPNTLLEQLKKLHDAQFDELLLSFPEAEAYLPAQATASRVDKVLALIRFLEQQEGLPRLEQALGRFQLPAWQRREMINRARRMERNHAYREAQEKWQELLALDPADEQAPEEIHRLEEKAVQAERLTRFKKDILKRKNDIAPIYMAVAARLKQLEKQDLDEEAEVLIDLVGDFLDGNTSGEEFIDLWTRGVAAPARIDPPNYQALAGRLRRGEIVLFLGMGSTAERLTPALAEQVNYPDFRGSFPEICQFLDINHQYRRGYLCEQLEHLLADAGIRADSLHICLAQVTVPVIIITTAFDSLLEDAFLTAGRAFVQVSHLRDNEQTGSLLLKYSDNPEVQACPLDDLSNLELLEQGYSVIYKLRGCLQVTRALNLKPGIHDGMLLSEWDYMRFVRYTDKLIPSYVLRQLTGRGLWLFGHYPRSWEDRLLLEAILQNRLGEEQPLTVQARPDEFAKVYWEHHHVKNYPLELQDFTEALQACI